VSRGRPPKSKANVADLRPKPTDDLGSAKRRIAELPVPQGDLTAARLCALARVSRAGYYPSFKASAPHLEEACVRDAIQRIAPKNRFYGYRRNPVGTVNTLP
jgi:hypothetical protein